MNPDIFLWTGAFGACVLLVAIVLVGVDRLRRRAAVRNRLAEARARVGLPDPAPDNQPGSNLPDLDALELLWAMPAYGTTTDHTTEEEL